MAEMLLSKIFTFDASHNLINLPAGHKCANLHGHTFKLVVTVKGEVDQLKGWVIDYSDIQKTVSPIVDILDHAYLNDISGLENPTSENIALFVWKNLKQVLPMLESVEIQETPTSSCLYRGG